MEDIKRKIRALLAKAGDAASTPAEVELCYAKAHELMVKYNISDIDQEKSKVVFGDKEFDADRYERILGLACGSMFNTRVVHYGGPGTPWKFSGRTSNVEMSEEFFIHLKQQVDKLYKLALPEGLTKTQRSSYRRNFKNAAAERVYCRIQAIVAANARALIVSPSAIEQEFNEFFGEGMKTATTSLAVKEDSFGSMAGQIAGHMVELGKEIKS